MQQTQWFKATNSTPPEHAIVWVFGGAEAGVQFGIWTGDGWVSTFDQEPIVVEAWLYPTRPSNPANVWISESENYPGRQIGPRSSWARGV